MTRSRRLCLQFSRIWGVAVDFLGIKDLLAIGPLEVDMALGLLFVERFAHRYTPVKTAAIAYVAAGAASDINAQPDAILIVIY